MSRRVDSGKAGGKKIKKFDAINYHVLESMEDLVRVSDEKGDTIYENIAMKKAIADDLMKEAVDRSHRSALSEFSKDLNITYKKEVTVSDKIYSLNISPVYEHEDKLLGYVEVFREITYESMIRQELIRVNQKIQEDISLAKNIQKSILPTIVDFKNLSFQYGHVASEQLSGDIFDVIQIDDDNLCIYIADVVGHGISASIMTMFIRQTMRNIITEHPYISLSDKVSMLKRRFGMLGLNVNQYFTLLICQVDTVNNTLTYVNAGHNAKPIMAYGKRAALMTNRGRFISNIFPETDYEEKQLKLIPGYRFFFYTDGLLETADAFGEFFGEERLLKWIENNTQEENVINKLIKDLNAYRWQEQKDDIAIVYMSVK